VKKDIAYEIKENGCWECISHSIDKSGYPKVKRDGKSYAASRWVYQDHFGKIPPGLVVRHKCDNPRCVNPGHLELGTVQDNINDRVTRGREGNRQGSRNGRAKLNEAMIPRILSRLKNSERQKDIALDLGVSQQIISRIKNGGAWQHSGEADQ
jgi:hypothetical protein